MKTFGLIVALCGIVILAIAIWATNNFTTLLVGMFLTMVGLLITAFSPNK